MFEFSSKSEIFEILRPLVDRKLRASIQKYIFSKAPSLRMLPRNPKSMHMGQFYNESEC